MPSQVEDQLEVLGAADMVSQVTATLDEINQGLRAPTFSCAKKFRVY